MNPDWLLIWPYAELPAVTLMLLVCTRLNRLITSTLICADFPPLKPMFLDNDTSVFLIGGVRTSVRRRGALPKVPAGATLTAAGLIQVAVGWSADANRSAKSPGVSKPTPVRFGRFAPPNNVLSVWVKPIGKPLCRLMTAEAVQPPASAFASPLVAQRRSLPNGSCQIGAMITRCGTSSTP